MPFRNSSATDAKGYALMLKRMILTDKRRKLPIQRNNSLHYGSDAGAEMAAFIIV